MTARARVAWLAAAVVAAAVAVAVPARGPRLASLHHGGNGPPTFVLLHGFGSSAARWAPFKHTIWLPPGGRFVFPDGPQRTRPPDGPVDGRAWWPLELAAYVPRGGTLPDLSASSPPGIVEAAALVHELIDHLPPRSRTPLVLGGFSQGAMVAAQLAFTSDDPVDALVLLSPTIVDERSWERAFASRRGLPVFVSHGRRDDVLPFDVTDRLRSKLARAGLEVTWCPFDGGHEIPAEVVVALNGFLQQRLRGDVTQPSGRRR